MAGHEHGFDALYPHLFKCLVGLDWLPKLDCHSFGHGFTPLANAPHASAVRMQIGVLPIAQLLYAVADTPSTIAADRWLSFMCVCHALSSAGVIADVQFMAFLDSVNNPMRQAHACGPALSDPRRFDCGGDIEVNSGCGHL